MMGGHSSDQKWNDHISHKSSVNIEFQNLSYHVNHKQNDKKVIINDVNGIFKCGQLSAILGPSGSGKTTLLNLLAGYKVQPTAGTILINNSKRDLVKFGKVCRYIMQDNCIQPFLSVEESMTFAANLKLSKRISSCQKNKIVWDILGRLGLESVKNVRTEALSGGQKKRLSIALELINEPVVLFLDEPTSGLDNTAAYQCIQLLQQLAASGRTIICSIHSPSAKMFSSFNHAYFISSGRCIYQGDSSGILSFLSHNGITCPTQFNPADFVIEICSTSDVTIEEQLVQCTGNGRNLFEKDEFTTYSSISEIVSSTLEKTSFKDENSFWNEFKILLLRMVLIQWRNKNHFKVKTVLPLSISSVIGLLFFQVGVDASRSIFQYGLFYICLVYFVYVPMMPLLIKVPLEMKYLKKEYFNKWYDIKSYYLALTLSTLPDQLVFGPLFTLIIYLLTSQPLEIYSFLAFYGTLLLVAAISEGYAIMVSSFMNVTNSTFFGCIFLIPFLLFGTFGFGEHYSTIPQMHKILMKTSYFRYAFEAIMVVMISNRKLDCPDTNDFCVYTDLNNLLKDVAMDSVVLWLNFLALIIILLSTKVLGYFLLQQRMVPNKFFQTIKQFIRKYQI